MCLAQARQVLQVPPSGALPSVARALGPPARVVRFALARGPWAPDPIGITPFDGLSIAPPARECNVKCGKISYQI